MPDGFPRPCPICKRTLIRGATKRCPDCLKGRNRLRDHPNRPWSRYYGHAWRKARKAYLMAHPFCVLCLDRGQQVRAIELDHIRPHEGSQDLFWRKSNWQPLCKRHHARKTLEETKRKQPDRFTGRQENTQ